MNQLSPTPPPVHPVRCPQCARDFFPPSGHLDRQVNCPHCFHIGTLNTFPIAQTLRFEELEHPELTTEQQAAEKVAASKVSQTKFMTIAASVVLGAVGLSIVVILKKKKGELAGLTSASATQTDKTAAFSVAKNFLATAVDKMPANLLRNPEAIQPLWDWYYAQPEAQRDAWSVQSCMEPKIYQTASNQSAMAMTVVTTSRKLDLLLEQNTTGWHVDWEAYSGVHGGRWQVFLKQERDFGPEGDYFVHVELMPEVRIMPSFRLEHPETAKPSTKILKFFAAEREANMAVAVVPANSPMAAVFSEITLGVLPVRMKLKLRMLKPKAYPPEVEPLELLQKGWDQLDPPL